MKLSMFRADFVTKYRISSHLWKSGNSMFDSIDSNSLIKQFYQRVTVCNSTCFGHSFHTALALRAKSFQEKENEYAHNIMENLPSYRGSVIKNPVQAVGISTSSISSEIVKEFAQVTLRAQAQNLSLENSRFSHLITNLSQTLPKLSNEDLVHILHHLCLWPSSPKSYSRNFKQIWNTLDFECVHRLKTWDSNLKLLVADYWFCLRLNRISQYNKNLISDLIDNLPTLSNQQVVQLMFYINLQRQIPRSYQSIMQKRLLSVVESVSVEEIGILCIGFFKTESEVDDFNIIKSIMARLSTEIDRVNTVTVAAILKFLKKSMQLHQTESYIPLLHKCVSRIHRWDIPTSIHSALLSTECHVYHPLLLDTVTRKVASYIESARIKDCTKLLQCLSHFNHYIESDFHTLFIQELKKDSRKPELKSYPRDLPYTSLFYAYLGRYDYEILNTVLAPGFIRDCLEKYPEMRNTFAEIDYCVGIECRDYVGPRLSTDDLKCLALRRGNLPTESWNHNMQSRILVEIFKSLDSLLFDKKNILVRHILPHFFSPDIVVRLSGGAQPLSDLCLDVPPDSVLVPPDDENWACIVVMTAFSFAYKSKHLTGAIAMKLRQLEVLGYKTVCIPFYEAKLVHRNRTSQAGVREAPPGTEETDKHLIFVYGTLKRNEPNHDIIQDTSEGSATYIGLGWSVEKWPLVIASRYNIPFLLHARGKGKHITGELYKVDDRMLANMDKLECHPKYYTRVQEEVQPEDPAATPVKPWIYFLMNYKEEMLHLPCLENYTSQGPHGLEYVARYNRTQGEYHRDVQM